MTARVGARVWVALGLVYVVWGSTYLAIRVVVEADLPPLLAMGSRFVTAGVLLAAFLVATRGGLRALRVTRANLLGAGVMGAFLLLGGNGMVALGEQTVPSGLAALIVGSVPLWFALLRVAGGERPGLLSWAGVLVGFAGVAAISLPGGGIEGVQAWGVGLVVVASILWSIGSYLSPRLHLPADVMVATTYEMLLGGALLLLGGTVRGELGGLDLAAVDPDGWVALAYLVVVGSIVGYTAYVYALGHAPLSLVGTYAYVNPVVAVLLGWAILSEPITSVVVGGGLLVVLGVALVVRGERRRPADEDEPPPVTAPAEEVSARR